MNKSNKLERRKKRLFAKERFWNSVAVILWLIIIVAIGLIGVVGPSVLIAAAISILLLLIIQLIKKSIENERYEIDGLLNTTCVDCGIKYQFPHNVRYTIKRTWTTADTVGYSNFSDIIEKTEALVLIRFLCPNCGKIKECEQTITIAKKRKNFSGVVLKQANYSLNEQIAKWVEGGCRPYYFAYQVLTI